MYGTRYSGARLKDVKVPESATNKQMISMVTGIDPQFITYWRSTDAFPAHAVIIDHEAKAVVLGIRGSTTVSDWIIDA
jgi:hypothetical protein